MAPRDPARDLRSSSAGRATQDLAPGAVRLATDVEGFVVDLTGGELPRGVVTLLFSEIEGSTRLLQEAGEEEYAELLATHQRLLREASAKQGGTEIGTEGDSFFVAFPE